MRQTFEQQSSGKAFHQADVRRSLYEDVTARIVGELEQGTVPWVKPWKDAANPNGVPLGLPRSAATRNYYSGINILILWDAAMTRGFSAQDWLSFRQCLTLGGHVKKGERGTTICYADRFIPRGGAAETTAQGGAIRPQADDEQPKAVPFLKRFTVFNLAQCENLPAHIVPPVKPAPLSADFAAADTLIAATGADVREGGGEAYYNPREDFIRLPPRAAFFSAADHFCTASHELSHWTSAPSRLNRDLQHRFGSTAYCREELIAELSSAFLCAHYGIVPQVRHADYLASWLSVLKSDAHAIFHAASQASKACDFLLARCRPAEGDAS